MLWKKEEICPFTLENGIVIDYMKDRFVMMIKDDVWTEYEIQAFQHHKLKLSFLYERVCAIFLFENVDSIDTSDVSFDIHNCEEAAALLANDQYDVEIYLIDQTNKFCAGRSVSFDKSASRIMKESLSKQMETPYDDAGFDHALEKIQSVYEPYEMEDMASIKCVF